jgi:dipicolinate synthase subunit A
MEIYKDNKIAFVGGDMRSTFAATRLAEKGYTVTAFGLQMNESVGKACSGTDIKEVISGARMLVLPIPTTLDGVTLNCKYEEGIALESILDPLEPDTVIVGGRLSGRISEHCKAHGISVYDCLEDEGFLDSNAYITAEAALSIAMDNLKKNIRDSSFAVTGFGRIAKHLSRLLRSLGAKVRVAARKEADVLTALELGCRTLRLGKDDIEELCGGYDVIFNTIPACILTESFMRKIDRRTLIIELASAPGGVDVSLAKRLHSNVLWAPSLPGKYAPESAGELIADCVRTILEGEVSE